MTSGKVSGADDEKKPPRRRWQATEPWFDFKASHWVEAALTAALLTVGGLQLGVYSRQTAIMAKQTEISERQLKDLSDQLNEMKAGSLQTDKLIAAAVDQAVAANKLVISSQDTLIAGNRAWLGQTNASVVSPISENERIFLAYPVDADTH